MSALPFEVLTIIFEELFTDDLGQCQLVSKLWHQASLKELYCIVTIDTEEKSRLYSRTIKRSPNYGKYLEMIYTADIFQEKKDNPIWDTHGLLDVVINHCPNIEEFAFFKTSPSFYTKLMQAASQGQLSRLQEISRLEGDDDFYVDTVLSFKKSINTLYLPNLKNDTPKLLDSEECPLIRKNLNQFPSLGSLSVSYNFERPLSHYDALIDDCKHLKELAILPSLDEEEGVEDMELLGINPRPDITVLECKWEIINEDKQLNYVMQKFPNLKSLSIGNQGFHYYYNTNKTSYDVLKDFLRFATNVQEVDLKMILEESKGVVAWGKIIKERRKSIDVRIHMSLCSDFEVPVVTVEHKENQLSLQFMQTPATDFMYNNFLYKCGKNIRKLVLEFCDNTIYNYHMLFCRIQDIITPIDHCPSLQHLELRFIYNLPFVDGMSYQHLEVKSLTFVHCNYWKANGTLKNISIMLPNLKKIVFNDDEIRYGKADAITIVMPDHSFDILKWTFARYNYTNINSYKVYMRLNINSVEKFYLACKDELSPISSKQYNHPGSDYLYLDITCKNLTELGMNEFTYIL